MRKDLQSIIPELCTEDADLEKLYGAVRGANDKTRKLLELVEVGSRYGVETSIAVFRSCETLLGWVELWERTERGGSLEKGWEKE